MASFPVEDDPDGTSMTPTFTKGWDKMRVALLIKTEFGCHLICKHNLQDRDLKAL